MKTKERKEYELNWRIKNKDHVRDLKREWTEKNRLNVNSYNAKWKRDHRTSVRKANFIYRKRFEKVHPIKTMKFIMYQNAMARVKGRSLSSNGKSYWEGFPMMKKEKFYKWFISNKWLIKKLMKSYLASNKERGLAPSLNRKNSLKGYVRSNIEIVTVRENSRQRWKLN